MEQFQAMLQWMALGRAVFEGGKALWTDIKAVFVKHGYADDTAALDKVMADAARRKALAENEARGHNG